MLLCKVHISKLNRPSKISQLKSVVLLKLPATTYNVCVSVSHLHQHSCWCGLASTSHRHWLDVVRHGDRHQLQMLSGTSQRHCCCCHISHAAVASVSAWQGRTCPKWPVLYWVGRKALTQLANTNAVGMSWAWSNALVFMMVSTYRQCWP